MRHRDRIFGYEFVEQVKAMGIEQLLSAPRSPWQTAHIERLIGSIRRECLDHLIVFNEHSLRRHLQASADYYHRTDQRTFYFGMSLISDWKPRYTLATKHLVRITVKFLLSLGARCPGKGDK